MVAVARHVCQSSQSCSIGSRLGALDGQGCTSALNITGVGHCHVEIFNHFV